MFQWQIAIAAVGMGVSLMLHSLTLKSKEGSDTTFLINVVDALDPDLFKNSVLYFTVIVLFLDQIGNIFMCFIKLYG